MDLVEKEKEQNLYEFMKSFESAFGKQLKEGKAGKFVIPYNSSLPRYELIHPLLTRFFEDVLQIGSVISEARAGKKFQNLQKLIFFRKLHSEQDGCLQRDQIHQWLRLG